MTQIERGLIPRCCTAGHHAPATSQALDAFFPRRGSHMFDDDVHAPVRRERSYAGYHVLLIVIDHVIGADLTRAVELGGAACGGNDACVKRPGNLYGGLSNAAAGREDED